jgi:hypothetical protein
VLVVATMSEFTIQKTRAAVELMLADGSTHHVELFLATTTPDHAGPQRLTDLMQQPGDFLPAFVGDGLPSMLINRSQLLCVRTALPADEVARYVDAVEPTEHRVEVLLAGGHTLAGLVAFQQPEGWPPVLDFLNERSPFFLLLESESVALVHKRHVLRVVHKPG